MKLVEYQPGKGTKTTALVVFICALAVRLALAAMRLFTGLMVSGTVTLELINFVVLLSAFFLVRRKRALLFFLLVLCLAVNSVLFLLHNDGAEYRFSSPGRTSTLVIRERSALLSSGWADMYRAKYGILLEPIDMRLGNGDKYHPFPSGQYFVEWDDEHAARLTYHDGTRYRELVLTL